MSSPLHPFLRSFLLALFFAAASSAFADRPAARAEYYGELRCSHCDTFVKEFLPETEQETGVKVLLEAYDILRAERYEQCRRRVESLGREFTIFPVLIIGNNVYQGSKAIEGNLAAELRYFGKNGTYRPRITEESTLKRKNIRFAFFPIAAAGLVDGINPCAFTTLLFFISFLGSRGKSRKRTALLGGTFILGIFAAYFFIGLGLFNVLRAGTNLSLFRFLLKVVVTGLTAVFCFLSIRDYVLVMQGRQMEMALQLPPPVKKKIHQVIRRETASAAALLGIFVTGLIVSLLELACTGQVYFPTISFMVQTDTSWLGIGSLLLYNIAFILPLTAILATILLGIRQERVNRFFSSHLGLSKILLAFVFASLAVLVWIL